MFREIILPLQNIRPPKKTTGVLFCQVNVPSRTSYYHTQVCYLDNVCLNYRYSSEFALLMCYSDKVCLNVRTLAKGVSDPSWISMIYSHHTVNRWDFIAVLSIIERIYQYIYIYG